MRSKTIFPSFLTADFEMQFDLSNFCSVFGGLGIAGYLGHLSYRVFKDSLVFPFALSLIGLAIIWLGVVFAWHADAQPFPLKPVRSSFRPPQAAGLM